MRNSPSTAPVPASRLGSGVCREAPRPSVLLVGLLLSFVSSMASWQAWAQDDAEIAALRHFLENTIEASSSFEDRFAAEVWLVDMQTRLRHFLPEPDARLKLLRQVHAAAARSDLPPELVLALIQVESSFDRFAVSSAGAQGLMQVMPFWKQEIGRPQDNLTDNATNLDYGCRILQFYMQREDGALHRALAAYNGSSGRRIYSDKVEAAWRDRWRTTPLDWSR